MYLIDRAGHYCNVLFYTDLRGMLVDQDEDVAVSQDEPDNYTDDFCSDLDSVDEPTAELSVASSESSRSVCSDLNRSEDDKKSVRYEKTIQYNTIQVVLFKTCFHYFTR